MRVLVFLSALFTLLFAALTPASALQFDVPAGEELCLTDEFADDTLVKGSLRLVGSGGTVMLHVADPDGRTVHQRPEVTSDAHFAFTTAMGTAGAFRERRGVERGVERVGEG